MTDIQNKLLELLVDLDTICQNQGIAYFLSFETAHAAFVNKEFYPDCSEASVAMTPDNALKFIAAVKKENRPDRVTDSMCTNKNYPDFSVRYGDPNTLMMQLPCNTPSPLPFIGVTIHMIRRKPKGAGRFYRYSSLYWKVCNKPTVFFDRPAVRAAATVCHAMKHILGGKLFSRWLFKRWCSVTTANRKAKKLAIGKGKYSYTAELLHAREPLELEGKQLQSFAYIDSHLKTAYGSSFRTKTPSYLKLYDNVMASVHIPYRKYLEQAKAHNVDFAAIRLNKAKYDSLQRRVSAYNKKITKYYNIVDRTDKRFAMYELYMPMKEQLFKMYEDEQYDELNELLHPYRSALWSCYKKGLGLCFDKEIFELTMQLLLREDSYTYVHKLRALVPKQHWEPMVITDYKGEPV